MSNMFSGKVKKPIPHSLASCTTPDPTATNLHIWAERLESWGRCLFIFLIAAGVIISLICGFSTADAYYRDAVPAFIGAFILSAASFALVAFIEYCTYHVLALLISSLACIVQNTIISANVALFSASQEFGSDESSFEADVPETDIPDETPAAPSSGWICKSCGQHNKQTAAFCVACGKDR